MIKCNGCDKTIRQTHILSSKLAVAYRWVLVKVKQNYFIKTISQVYRIITLFQGNILHLDYDLDRFFDSVFKPKKYSRFASFCWLRFQFQLFYLWYGTNQDLFEFTAFSGSELCIFHYTYSSNKNQLMIFKMALSCAPFVPLWILCRFGSKPMCSIKT